MYARIVRILTPTLYRRTFTRFAMKGFNSAAEANKGPITSALHQYLDKNSFKQETPYFLEIASGSGQHVVHFAKEFPFVQFQPSECTESNINSIQAYIEESGLDNVLKPILIDITTPYDSWLNGQFKENSVDYIICINMIHITPLICTEWLFENSGNILKHQGMLFTYGPYAFDGVLTPESNQRFHQSLKSMNPQWGVRDVELLKSLASQSNLQFAGSHSLPANNHLLAWKKGGFGDFVDEEKCTHAIRRIGLKAGGPVCCMMSVHIKESFLGSNPRSAKSPGVGAPPPPGVGNNLEAVQADFKQ